MKNNREFIKRLYENGGIFYVCSNISKPHCSICDENMVYQQIDGDCVVQVLFNLVKHMFNAVNINTDKIAASSFNEIKYAFNELNLDIVEIESSDEMIKYQLMQIPVTIKYDNAFQCAFDDENDMSVDECKVIARYEFKKIDADAILKQLSGKILSFDEIVKKVRETVDIPMDNAFMDISNDELMIVFDLLKHQLFISVFVAPVADRGFLVYETEILSN